MKTLLFSLAFLTGCQSMGYNAGYKAGREHYFENKKPKVWSYAWGFHHGWTVAQIDWRISLKDDK